MLVRCQVCDANVSDQAVACPKCGSEKPAFLGLESYCYECGASIRAAYQACAGCGAPRSKVRPAAEVSSPIAPEAPIKTAPVFQSPEPEPPRRYETIKPKGNRGIGRFVGGLVFTLVAMVVGIFVSGLVREMLNQKPVQKETVTVAELEKIFSGTDEGRLFAFIKSELPDDYAAIMNRLVSFMNTSEEFSSEKAAFDAGYAQGAEVMDDFLQANFVHVQTAPDTELISMGIVMEGLFDVLKTRDIALCASLARGNTLQESDKAKVKSYGINLTDVDIVVFAAISAGKKNPVSRAPATESDWEELFSRVYPILLAESFDELLNTDDPLQMTDRSLCDMTSAMMSEIMKDTPDRQAMWLASMYEDAEAISP